MTRSLRLADNREPVQPVNSVSYGHLVTWPVTYWENIHRLPETPAIPGTHPRYHMQNPPALCWPTTGHTWNRGGRYCTTPSAAGETSKGSTGASYSFGDTTTTCATLDISTGDFRGFSGWNRIFWWNNFTEVNRTDNLPVHNDWRQRRITVNRPGTLVIKSIQINTCSACPGTEGRWILLCRYWWGQYRRQHEILVRSANHGSGSQTGKFSHR